MKLSEVLQRYPSVSEKALIHWLKSGGWPHTHKPGTINITLDDSTDIDALVAAFRAAKAKEIANLGTELHERKARQEALAGILITSGFGFDGFAITKYSGYISGDDVISVNRPSQGWFGGVAGNVGHSLMSSLAELRRNALAELKGAALDLGCNAVIGVDFDYITLDPETAGNNGGTLYLPFLFGVTANGNAVVIEKK